MKRKSLIFAILAGILAFVGWWGWRFKTYDARMQRIGYELMDTIDAYYAMHHRLPNQVSELGDIVKEDYMSFEFKGETFYYDILADSVSYWIGYLDKQDFGITHSCPSTTRVWNSNAVVADGLYLTTSEECDWYKDSCGCLHERNGIMADSIIMRFNLVGKDTTEFLRHFGTYNVRTQQNDGFCYGYYVNSVCEEGQIIADADKSILLFWFDKSGLLTDKEPWLKVE